MSKQPGMMKDFQALHPDMGSGTRAYAQAIEKTEANIQWMKKNYDIINKWLPGTIQYLKIKLSGKK
ncbi:hypothetical protein KUTeg_010700 [Tegillarca granosa]|uniref:Uncharacterized protein n=1 Tax=Tegillarca granosa TaxID=220873 RepID=A0ABQ9F1S1_TEGGR|nr:hypothetical protein KUTeg_010700 [Tegillarca granosa]